VSDVKLFRSQSGDWVTERDLARALESVGAGSCDVMYMHTGMAFGAPNPDLSRAALLGNLYQIVRGLGANTLCVPTFTFSFCNGQAYDVEKSRSKMGALNEYIRGLDEATRSVDPLMSVAMVGEHRELVEDLGHECLGDDGTFGRLHATPGAKFLFLGASPSQCFTYIHFVEAQERVPYRYSRDFSGTIIAGGREYEDTYSLYVRYANVVPGGGGLEEEMVREGLLRRVGCGDGTIGCLDEPATISWPRHTRERGWTRNSGSTTWSVCEGNPWASS
jgi:aminoglycoside 3-N-acetyltransferase